MANQICERIASIQDRITKAAQAAGRDPSEIRLLPVSKTRPVEDLIAASQSGICRFGENRVQEILAKSEAAPQLEFALIGHLQTNKAAKIAGLLAEFQALDSLRLAKILDNQMAELGRQLPVLIEVNSSGEDSKFGLPVDQVIDFAEQLAQCPNLSVRGLMTIALPSPDEAKVAACFEKMRQLQTLLKDQQVLDSDWAELSMGMSNDFELAIAHGATCVRVGTAIFGQR